MKVRYNIMTEFAIEERNFANVKNKIEEIGKEGFNKILNDYLEEELRAFFHRENILALEVKSKVIKE